MALGQATDVMGLNGELEFMLQQLQGSLTTHAARQPGSHLPLPRAPATARRWAARRARGGGGVRAPRGVASSLSDPLAGAGNRGSNRERGCVSLIRGVIASGGRLKTHYSWYVATPFEHSPDVVVPLPLGPALDSYTTRCHQIIKTVIGFLL